MIHRFSNSKCLLTIASLLLVLLTTLGALAEEAVFNTDSRIYQQPNLSSRYVALEKGTDAELLAVSGKWAQIRVRGVVGYTNADHLTVQADEPDYDSLMENAQAAVVTKATRVYQRPSTSSASLKVKTGMKVNLLAVGGKWALVEKGGCYAYMNAAHVEAVEDTPDYEALMKSAQPAIILENTRVYQRASTSSASLKVRTGMEVNLLAVNDGWALIENSGSYAYMDASKVAVGPWNAPETAPVPTSTPTPTATPAPTAAPDYSALLANAKSAVLSKDAKVYLQADASGDSTSVSKGTQVRLLAVSNGWALVERGGAYGFVASDCVTLEVSATATPTPAPTKKPVVSDYLSSDKYTNEEKCYLFLTNEMKLNAAAACGVLANIRSESNFNPDIGSSYYGLCQWGGGRLSNLKSFCSEKGYSASSLTGQLYFLKYELETSAPAVLKKIQSVSDSPEGAYEAGYAFCYDYERPASKASASVKRGNMAKDDYYPKYI